MTEMNLAIEREDGPGGGRYVVQLAPGFEGEMTYRKLAADTIVIDHTGVPEEFEGRGVARKLVEHAIADARATGTKIVPLCSYVVAQFRRHPEWADLLAR